MFAKFPCFLLWLFCLSTPEKIVYINQENGTDKSDCLNSHNPCKSLEFVSRGIGNFSSGLTIDIETKELLLNDLISFKNFASLNITSNVNLSDTRVLITSNFSQMNAKTCGLQFYNITNLTLFGIAMSECEYFVDYISIRRYTALHVHLSANVLISNVLISEVQGTALIVSDTDGFVVIENSLFKNNTYSEMPKNNTTFAGGILLQFNRSYIERITEYYVQNCTFQENKHLKKLDNGPPNDILYGYGMGGGMSVIFMNSIEQVNVFVENCSFIDNKAYSGAGLYVDFQDSSSNNTITVKESCFKLNDAFVGGGMSIGMAKLQESNLTFNRVVMQDNVFNNNFAHYGGGTAIFAVHSMYFSKEREETIYFHRCRWLNNRGFYSSAVDISPLEFDYQGFLPMPRFNQCTFIGNEVLFTKVHNNGEAHYQSFGVFVISIFEVQFSGENEFANNTYTALFLSSGTLILEKNTVMKFDSNKGVKGGAMAMYGFSVLKGMDNCKVIFHNNSASEVGGGIYYQTFEQRELIAGKSCFIQYIGNLNVIERNLSFIFTNNTANWKGTSIFSTSFHSCFYAHLGNSTRNLTAFFSKIGNFQFDDNTDDMTALATEGIRFHIETLNATVPGKQLSILLNVSDEFNNTVHTQAGLQVFSQTECKRYAYKPLPENLTLSYTYHGEQNRNITLLLSTLNTVRDTYYCINVSVQSCAPGYYFDEESGSCECSVNDKTRSYNAITKCNDTLYQAYIQQQHWAGYYNNDTLYTAPCIFQTCDINSKSGHDHLLPKSKDELNQLMCGRTKKGLVCGECNSNYSAHFHSDAVKCGPKKLCHISILFYVISELVPVTILFTLVIWFDVSFATGGISGLIFFSQMVETVRTDHDKILLFNNSSSTYKSTIKYFKIFQMGHTLIYNILNFEFFAIDTLSFCLWHGAKPMDVLIFKYVTTIFTLILISGLVRIMNSRWFVRFNRNTKPQTVVNGLSTFLILSYSQCASVTFKILGHRSILSNKIAERRVIHATQYGGLEYFSTEHLYYAIPAIISLVVFVITPPLLLLTYPLLLQMLSLCSLSEHRIIQYILERILNIHKFMPLFDAFQSSFKNKFRFFAGLYFVYKASILVVHSSSNNSLTLYGITELIFVFILGIHSIIQPYKKKLHNVIDSLIFLNLSTINGLNIYNNVATDLFPGSDYHLLVTTSVIQMFLIYLPIIIALCRVIYLVFKKRQHNNYQNIEDNNHFPDNEARNLIEDA